MKSIETLIKVSKQELDVKRKELKEIEEQKQKLLKWQKDMNDELRREEQFAAQNPHMSMTFDSYRQKVNQMQLNMHVALQETDNQIESISLQISALFSEVKKYEIVHQQKLTQLLKEQRKKETKALDEIALNNYLKEQSD